MITTRRLLLAPLAAALAVFLGCRESPPLGVDPREPGPQALWGSLSESTGLLTCSPVPYDSTTQTIGPDGGIILVGLHSLSIPAGAFDSAVTITAVAPSDNVNRVQFQPAGLVFDPPASLRMSYANCNLLGSLAPKRIAYVDDALNILYYLLSADNLLNKTVTGRLEHFSEYAIAW